MELHSIMRLIASVRLRLRHDLPRPLQIYLGIINNAGRSAIAVADERLWHAAADTTPWPPKYDRLHDRLESSQHGLYEVADTRHENKNKKFLKDGRTKAQGEAS